MNDRVHFYERQYLRAFDLVAEQAYHLEMRRRLNLALHMWGIVVGFDIAKASVVPGSPEQFIVSAGMAIDGYGREIVSPDAYALSDDDLRRNSVRDPMDYWLSIAYRRELTTPPAPGYRPCDLKDQYTRWHESFAFLLTPADPTPTIAPAVTDELPDDPTDHEWPVVLGKVRVKRDASGDLVIDDAWLESRVYVGSRTEHLVSPVASLPSGTAEASKPVRIEADALAEKNLAIFEDFFVDKNKVKPAPAAPTFPTATGNLKLGTDLFVRGEIYKFNPASGEWLALKEGLAQFMPDIQLPSTLPHVINTAKSGATGDNSTGVSTISLTTRLVNPSKADLVVAIAGIRWLSTENEKTWRNNIQGNAVAKLANIEVSVKARPNPVKTAVLNGTKYDFEVEWTVGPTFLTAAPELPIVQIAVMCFGIFMP